MIELPPIEPDAEERATEVVLRHIAREVPLLLKSKRCGVAIKGGTGLRLGYGLPRPSTDIDFDLTDAVPMEEMVSKAMENCPYMTNVRVDTKQRGRGYIRIVGTFDDGMEKCALRLKVDHKVLTAEENELRPLGEWIVEGDFPVYQMSYLAELKLNTMTGVMPRAAPRDIYDAAWLVIHYRDAVQKTQLEELRRWGDEYLANEDQQEHCRKEFDKDKVMRRIEPDTVVLALLEALEKHPSGDHGGPEMKP